MGILDILCCNATHDNDNHTIPTLSSSAAARAAAGPTRSSASTPKRSRFGYYKQKTIHHSWQQPILHNISHPHITTYKNKYYLTVSKQQRSIYQYVSDSVSTLSSATPKCIWSTDLIQPQPHVSSTATTPRSSVSTPRASASSSFPSSSARVEHEMGESYGLPVDELCSPEMHHVFNGWYIYFSASHKRGASYHRIYVLQSTTNQPEGPYQYLGQVSTNDGLAHGMWCTDPSLFTTADKQTWLVYSGNIFSSDNHEGNQKLWLLPLRNPLTPLDTHRASCVSQPDCQWERNHGKPNIPLVNAQPSACVVGNSVYIAYTASHYTQATSSIGVVYMRISEGLNSTQVLTQSPYNVNRSETYDKYTYAKSHNYGSEFVWSKIDKPLLSSTTIGIAGCSMNSIRGGSFFHSPDNSQIWYIFHFKKNSQGSNSTVIGRDDEWHSTIVKVQIHEKSKKQPIIFLVGESCTVNTRLPSGDSKQQQYIQMLQQPAHHM